MLVKYTWRQKSKRHTNIERSNRIHYFLLISLRFGFFFWLSVFFLFEFKMVQSTDYVVCRCSNLTEKRWMLFKSLKFRNRNTQEIKNSLPINCLAFLRIWSEFDVFGASLGAFSSVYGLYWVISKITFNSNGRTDTYPQTFLIYD